jgi:hypothetical protein
MMGGGGGKMAWTAGGVVTENEGDEGLCCAEALIPSLALGDKASGVRGCNTDGSKTSLDAKASDRVLPRFRGGKGSRSRLDKLSVFRKRKRICSLEYCSPNWRWKPFASIIFQGYLRQLRVLGLDEIACGFYWEPELFLGFNIYIYFYFLLLKAN